MQRRSEETEVPADADRARTVDLPEFGLDVPMWIRRSREWPASTGSTRTSSRLAGSPITLGSYPGTSWESVNVQTQMTASIPRL